MNYPSFPEDAGKNDFQLYALPWYFSILSKVRANFPIQWTNKLCMMDKQKNL